MVFAFKELSPRDVKKFISDLDKNNMNRGLNASTTKVLSQKLSFAEDWQRMDCEDYSETPHVKCQYLSNGTIILPFAFGPEPHSGILNHISLSLHSDNIIDYVTLYFSLFYKNGEKIVPVFHSDDIDWQEDLSPMIKKALDIEFSKYPVIDETNDKISVEFLALFRQSIMKLDCTVEKNGEVCIQNRSMIADDLPIQS